MNLFFVQVFFHVVKGRIILLWNFFINFLTRYNKSLIWATNNKPHLRKVYKINKIFWRSEKTFFAIADQLWNEQRSFANLIFIFNFFFRKMKKLKIEKFYVFCWFFFVEGKKKSKRFRCFQVKAGFFCSSGGWV